MLQLQFPLCEWTQSCALQLNAHVLVTHGTGEGEAFRFSV